MAVYYPDDPDRAARQAQRVIDLMEERVEEAVALATKHLLDRMLTEIQTSLVADVGPEEARRGREAVGSTFFSLGAVRRFWEEGVDEFVINAVRQAFDSGRASVVDDPATVTSLDRTGEYLANVRDRLSRTADPPIPDQAFDTVRKVAAQEIAVGTTTDRMAQRLAEELKWEGPSANFLRSRRVDLERRIEQRLESAELEGISRQVARRTDPTIRLLQDERTDVVKQQDADKSVWQTRAERIARTETTGAYNAGAYAAQQEADVGVRMWVATPDGATRETHLDMSGTCVPVGEPFVFPDGSELMFPGDPSGPPGETINCRCTTVSGVSCEQLGTVTKRLGVDEVFEQEIQRRANVGQEQQLEEALRQMRHMRPLETRLAADTAWREMGLDETQRTILAYTCFDRGGQPGDRVRKEDLDKLPQGVVIPAPAHKVGDQENVGTGAFMVRDGTLFYVENEALTQHMERALELEPGERDVFVSQKEALDRIADEFASSFPGGYVEAVGEAPNPTVYYKAGASDRDRHAVAGESVGILGAVYTNNQDLFMYGAGLRADTDGFINRRTLVHETAHGLAGNLNRHAHLEGARRYQAVMDKYAAQGADAFPDPIREVTEWALEEREKGNVDFAGDSLFLMSDKGRRVLRDEYVARNGDAVRERFESDPEFRRELGYSQWDNFDDLREGEQRADAEFYAGQAVRDEFEKLVNDVIAPAHTEAADARDSFDTPFFFNDMGSAAPGLGWETAASVDGTARFQSQQLASNVATRTKTALADVRDDAFELERKTDPADEAGIGNDPADHDIDAFLRARETKERADREIDAVVDAYVWSPERYSLNLDSGQLAPAVTDEERELLAPHFFVPLVHEAGKLTVEHQQTWGHENPFTGEIAKPMESVSKYGASSGDWSEDFADAYQAWWSSRTLPEFGYSALTGEPVGFEDLYPARDEYFLQLFAHLGLEVPPVPTDRQPSVPARVRVLEQPDLDPDQLRTFPYMERTLELAREAVGNREIRNRREDDE